MVERRHSNIVGVFVLGALLSSCAHSHDPDSSSGTNWLGFVPCQEDRRCDTVDGAVACGADGYCVDDAGEPVAIAPAADLDAGPPGPTDAGVLDRCNMECRAKGADSDGRPIEYVLRARVEPDGSQWMWCGLAGEGVGGHQRDDCQAALDEGCAAGGQVITDDGLFTTRELQFTFAADALLLDGTMHVFEGTTDPAQARLIGTWAATLPYSSCGPVTDSSVGSLIKPSE